MERILWIFFKCFAISKNKDLIILIINDQHFDIKSILMFQNYQ